MMRPSSDSARRYLAILLAFLTVLSTTPGALAAPSEQVQTGTIEVCKIVITPLGEIAGAGIAIALSGQATRNGVTDGQGCVTFSSLPPGNYTIAETLPPGFVAVLPPTGSTTVSLEA